MGEINKIHFIGIGGIGMSALARLFLHEGKEVSGSDRAPSEITGALEKEGVAFFGSQSAENITNAIDIVVYTEAMSADQPEMVAAKQLGVPMMNYFDALAMVANEYYLIAVAGTHGKTTTTAMLVDIFEEAELEPTAVVGSLRAKTKSNFRAGKSKYFIVEACEYRRDFMSLEPDILIITNIEADHLDYYSDLEDIQNAFKELAEKVPEDGVVVADTTNVNIVPVVTGLKSKVIDYKQAINLQLSMKQPGLHNRMNAAAAKAAASECDIEESVINQALSDFRGTWRRFEYKGELNGAPVYDDYAHHPTAIEATIAGAREMYPDKKVVVVFQPHLYSRTEELFDGFVTSLSKADRVVLTHVYDARNTGKSGVTGDKLAEAVKEMNPDTQYFEDFADVVTELKNSITTEDMLIIMGAGDVTKVTSGLTE